MTDANVDMDATASSSSSTSAAAASSSSSTYNQMEVDGEKSSSASNDITKRMKELQDEIDSYAKKLKAVTDILMDTATLKQLWKAMPADEQGLFKDAKTGQPDMGVYREELKSQQASLKEERDRLEKERDRLEKQQHPSLQASSLGKRERIDGVSAVPIRKFWKRVLESPLILTNYLKLDANHRVINLPYKLNGADKAPDALYFRSCYASILADVKGQFSGGGEKLVLIAGTRGIGKSVFGTLAVLDFARAGEVVLYQHYGRTLLIFLKVPNIDQIPLQMYLNEKGIDMPEPGVYEITMHVDLVSVLKGDKEVITVLDVGDSMTGPIIREGEGPLLIISSPNSEKMANFRMTPPLIVMPTWTVEELEEARVSIYAKLPPALYPQYTEQEVKKRFDLFGGVPRWVLEAPRPSEHKAGGIIEITAEDALDAAISSFNLDELEAMLRAATYIALPAQKKCGILVHIVEPRVGGSYVRFASPAIRKMLVKQLLRAQNFGIAAFINASKRVPELGGYRGYALENGFHLTIEQGTKASIRQLGAKSNSSNFVDTEVKKSIGDALVFADENLQDITKVAVGQYVYPFTKMYPTVDSFELLPYKYINPTADGNLGEEVCLVMYQVTVSKSHKVDGVILKRIQGHLSRLLNLESPLKMILVFVSGSNGIATAQKILNGEGKPYQPNYAPDVEQFVLRVHGPFEELMRFAEKEEEDTSLAASSSSSSAS